MTKSSQSMLLTMF